MPYTERPDIAMTGSSAMNQAVYGESSVMPEENFGPATVPIYIYNIAPLEHNEPRPPNHPHMLIRACPKGEPYKIVGQISHPFAEINYDQNDNRIVRWTNGPREATRMLNPSNPGVDQNFDDPNAFNEGGNLNAYGVFWSMHNPPLAEELEAATKRMETRFRKRLEVMAQIEAKDPQGARDAATRVDHAAAEYYGISASWHRSDLRPKSAGKVPCWACGEDIQAVALICKECRAPQAEDKRESWLDAQSGKRGPGRPANA
jgi:hypothetical protein